MAFLAEKTEKVCRGKKTREVGKFLKHKQRKCFFENTLIGMKMGGKNEGKNVLYRTHLYNEVEGKSFKIGIISISHPYISLFLRQVGESEFWPYTTGFSPTLLLTL